MAQRKSSVSWTQRTPGRLPSGMPGIGLLIDGAMQQAAQAERHSMVRMDCVRETSAGAAPSNLGA